ncbi:hypothetical protein [Sphaerothrix gracilis]|uniref:hypothetical protein n=1 Tax=Sphaerothrix gracilis TaxID=3151835 RepID=UPI0031FC2F23
MAKAIALLSLLLWLAIAAPAQAFSRCQRQTEPEICILSLKRSAKYYWQYRAEVSIGGVKRPVEVYDCRRRMRTRSDGETVPFQADGPGSFICSFFKQ